MDFSFAQDQELIRKSAKEFFEKECPKDKVRELKEEPKGYDPNMWKKMAKLEFMGLVIPEEYGGTEGEFVDLMIFMEEIGRNIVPCPYFSTVVCCAMPVLEFGTDKQKKEILPKIAQKGEIWTLALTEESVSYEAEDIKLKADLDKDAYLLTGTKLFVSYANVAKKMLVVARTSENGNASDGITVFIVDAKTKGISIEVIPTTARDMRCEVKFDNVRISKENILGEAGKGWEVIDYLIQHASVLKAAEMSGGAQAVFELTTKYTKERIQFDKPIASFQAIQFRLVELLTEVESLKYLVHKAAWNINVGTSNRILNSIAKAKANSVYHRACYQGIVMHGAVGWTEEMDIGLYHLRTKSLEFDAGEADFHKEKIVCDLEQKEPLFLSLYK